MKLFIGNIPYSMSEKQLRELLEKFGALASLKLIMDQETGRSKGFGFAEFENQDDAERAMEELNDAEVQGKKLVVNKARPQEKKTGGGGGGGFRRAPR